MVKVTQEISVCGDYKYTLEIDLIDLIRAKPSRFASDAKAVYNATKKTSDLLFWLSEEIKAIEESERKTKSSVAVTDIQRNV